MTAPHAQMAQCLAVLFVAISASVMLFTPRFLSGVGTPAAGEANQEDER